MTLRNFPPADQCSPEDLDAIADLVVIDPETSWGLAGSREHIEALCRQYQVLVQDRAVSARTIEESAAEHAAVIRDNRALQERVAAVTNDLDAARRAISEREDEIASVNNERQAEVNEAATQRERADAAEAMVEGYEAIARAALALVTRGAPVSLAELVHAVDGRLSRALVRERLLAVKLDLRMLELEKRLEDTAMLLDQQREDHEANDRIRSALADACLGITGQAIEQVNIQLDAELAAHPEPGPLHHARDQRETDGGL